MSVLMSKDKKELIVTCNCKCGQSFHITVDDEDRDSDIMFYLCYMKNNFDTEYDMNPWRAFKIKMKKIWFIIRGNWYKSCCASIYQSGKCYMEFRQTCGCMGS